MSPASKAVAAVLLTGLAQYAVGRATVLSRGPALADSGYYVKAIGEIAAMIAICIVSFAVGCWPLRVRAWFAAALAMVLAEAVLAGEAWHLLPRLGTGRFVVIAAILVAEYWW